MLKMITAGIVNAYGSMATTVSSTVPHTVVVALARVGTPVPVNLEQQKVVVSALRIEIRVPTALACTTYVRV